MKSSKIWPIAFLIAIIIYNLTEAMLLVQNNVAWIIIAFLGFGITRSKNSTQFDEKTLSDQNPPPRSMNENRIEYTYHQSSQNLS